MNGALRADAELVLMFLNRRVGKSFQPVEETLRPIIARLRAGATVAQCRGIVAMKLREWGDDAKMRKYIRPKTLFSAENFANYRGEIPPPTPEMTS